MNSGQEPSRRIDLPGELALISVQAGVVQHRFCEVPVSFRVGEPIRVQEDFERSLLPLKPLISTEPEKVVSVG